MINRSVQDRFEEISQKAYEESKDSLGKIDEFLIKGYGINLEPQGNISIDDIPF